MHLIGWQNTWEQAPGVPATPFPALMAGETPGRVPVYTALAHPITPGTEPPGVKIPPSRVMATQAPSQHIENAESVQSADAEQWTRQRSGIDGASSHVTVKDIAADTQLEQWTSTSRCTSHSRQELPDTYSYPCHAQKASTTHRWCVTAAK